MKLKNLNLLAISIAFVVSILVNRNYSFAQPANDNCSYAQVLSVSPYGNCSYTSGTTASATQNIPGCAGNADDDVWYQFTATSSALKIEVIGAAGFDAVLQVFSGTCSTLVSKKCVDNTASGGTETYTATNFVIGQVYRFRVYHYGIGSGSGNFSVCVSEAPAAPANDICGNAVTLPVNSSCQPQAFDNHWATQSYPGCAGDADDDVWFKFTATNSVQTITVDPSGVGTGLMDPVVELYSGAGCNVLNSMICTDNGWFGEPEVINAVGLIPGQTYYIRVYDYYSNWTDEFEICITGAQTAAPTNDEPCNAISLPLVTSACNYSRFTNLGATQTSTANAPTPTHNPTSCETGSSTGYTANAGDVWFKVTVPSSGTIHVTMEPNLGSTGMVKDGVMALYTGTCGNLTQIAYSNDYSCYPPSVSNPNPALMPFISQSGLTPGTDVYIRFWNWGSSDKGEFGLCVTEAMNDDCADALYICDINGYKGTTGAYYTVDRPGGMRGNCETAAPNFTYDPGTDHGGMFGYWSNPATRSPNLDVQIDNNSWIRFTAASTTAVLNVNVSDCYRNRGIQMQIFASNGCTNFVPTSEFKEDNNSFTLTATNLTVGDDYLLMIDGYAGDICNYTISANSGVKFPDITPLNPTVCGGTPTTLYAPPGASSYEWQHSGETTQSVTVNPSTTTTYTCVVTGLCDYKQILSTQITVVQNPTIILSTGTSADLCVGKSLTITASGANTYSWSNGSSGNSITVNPSSNTSYTVTGTTNGCSNTETVAVNVHPLPSFSLSANNTTICAGESAQITANGSGLTYSWSNGLGSGASKTVSPTSTTTYQVKATNSNGCEKTESITITVNPRPNVNVNPSSATICRGDNVILNASGASSYSWNQGLGNGNTKNVSPTSTTTYIVTGTGSNSCTNQKSVTITVNPTPSINGTASASDSDCNEDNGSISGLSVSGGTSGYTYSWTNAGGINVGNTLNVSGLGIGNYTLTVTDSRGCKAIYGPVNISNPSAPAQPVINLVGATCDNDGSASIQNYNSSIDYEFSDPSVSENNGNIVGATPGQNYTISSTSAGCSSGNVGFVIEPQLEAPDVIATSTKGEICDGESVTISASGASSYSWDHGLGNGDTYQVSPTSTTTYNVTGTGSNGCVATASTTVIVNPNPSLSISASANEICIGESTTLTASGASTYTWDHGLGNGATKTVSPTTTTTYQVTGTSTKSCSSTETIQVSVNELPTLTGSSVAVSCFEGDDGSATVNATGNGGFTYQWNDAGSQTSATATGLAAGNYTVIVTDAKGCVNQETIVVTEPDQLALSGSTTVSACTANTGTASVQVTGGTTPYSYSWNDDFNQTTSTAYDLGVGNYSVTVTDENGCTEEISVNVSNANAPILQVEEVNNVNCAEESDGSITVSASGGTGDYSYNWLPSGQTGETAMNLPEGNHIITVTDDAGCSSVETINISANNPKPSIEINAGLLEVCEDGTIQIETEVTDAGSNPGYNWNGPNGYTSTSASPTLFDVENNQTGTYTVTVIGDGGCVSDEASIEINVNPKPVVTLTVENDKICEGEEIIISGTFDLDGSYIYAWDGPNGFSSDEEVIYISEADVSAEGTYTLTAISEAGCEGDEEAIFITVYPSPVLDTLYNSEYKVCLGTAVDMSLLHYEEPNTYYWYLEDDELVNQGEHYTLEKANFSDGGTYSIYVDSENGCTALAETIKLVVKACDISIVETFSPNGDGVNDYFHIDNLEGYPNTEVWIFTRWGHEVYHNEDYQNDWDGTSQNKMKFGDSEILPEGTYYYVIILGGDKDTPNSGEEYKGFVYLKR